MAAQGLGNMPAEQKQYITGGKRLKAKQMRPDYGKTVGKADVKKGIVEGSAMDMKMGMVEGRPDAMKMGMKKMPMKKGKK